MVLKSTGGKDGWDMMMTSAAGLTGAPFLTVDAYTQWKDTIATPDFQQYLADQIDDAGLAKALTEGWHPGQPLSTRAGGQIPATRPTHPRDEGPDVN